MAPPAAAVEGREGLTRSARNSQNAYSSLKSVGDAAAGGKGANMYGTVLGKRGRSSEKSDGEDGTATPGPNTPATTNSGGGLENTAIGGGGGGGDKKHRAAWSQEAVALGYEAGTIKNSAYLLLAESGAKGMTVAAIVDAATKQGCVIFRIIFTTPPTGTQFPPNL